MPELLTVNSRYLCQYRPGIITFRWLNIPVHPVLSGPISGGLTLQVSQSQANLFEVYLPTPFNDFKPWSFSLEVWSGRFHERTPMWGFYNCTVTRIDFEDGPLPGSATAELSLSFIGFDGDIERAREVFGGRNTADAG